jgi:hypothetical protein
MRSWRVRACHFPCFLPGPCLPSSFVSTQATTYETQKSYFLGSCTATFIRVLSHQFILALTRPATRWMSPLRRTTSV